MIENKPLTEQEWIYRYAKSKDKPLPLVMGTKGTWGMNGEPWIILVALSFNDIMVLCDLHHVPLSDIRKMKIHDLTYYAASITDRLRVKEIMDSWQRLQPVIDTTSASPQSQGSS